MRAAPRGRCGPRSSPVPLAEAVGVMSLPFMGRQLTETVPCADPSAVARIGGDEEAGDALAAGGLVVRIEQHAGSADREWLDKRAPDQTAQLQAGSADEIILCGTPAPSQPGEVGAQVKVADHVIWICRVHALVHQAQEVGVVGCMQECDALGEAGHECGFRAEAGRHSDQLPATVPIRWLT